MLYITYLDQIKITGKFQNSDQIKAVRPRVVKAVGYEVKKDDTGVFIASTINGSLFKDVLFIPKPAIIEVVSDAETLTGEEELIEIEYVEAQGIEKIARDKLETFPKPPVVKLCGFKANEDEDLIYVAQEKNVDGAFRTIVAVPKKYIVPAVSGKLEK